MEKPYVSTDLILFNKVGDPNEFPKLDVCDVKIDPIYFPVSESSKIDMGEMYVRPGRFVPVIDILESNWGMPCE